MDRHPYQSGLFTDHYQLTMAQGYFLQGRQETSAVFDYFFRRCPFGGAYVVYAGLETLLDALEGFHFSAEDCDFLREQGFGEAFTDYLRDFRFRGDIFSPPEGELVFPHAPVLRVEGNLIECQLIETLVLNVLNFQSLIATKAARIRQVIGPDRTLMEFGLRRAQGLGGIHATRAALVGGAESTSNVYAARAFGVPSVGTQAHAWIQSFDDELTAFREFARHYPDNCILLVDTYDTIRSGVPNAIIVARELAKEGHALAGIRLDSGDLLALSQAARAQLDAAGLKDVHIVASNQLDEFKIAALLDAGAPIDSFGVGTDLATGKDDANLDGIYKLAMSGGKDRLKLSESPAKAILPGSKEVRRYFDAEGGMAADVVCRNTDGKSIDARLLPKPGESLPLKGLRYEVLQQPVMTGGHRTAPPRQAKQIRECVQNNLSRLPQGYKALNNPAAYPVAASHELLEHRLHLQNEIRSRL
ncbi:nicotinate phosphoribosyltransferase [Coraliomargarita parva]|uniref:nicotinate phosphoribosyltransferase n=1 Tax=Coraliomargarita parva TaxID=3014050 RepID=UPI0022B34632|nr:nicotinate phosphoribosyltransferase [Coraliomargarita parva]